MAGTAYENCLTAMYGLRRFGIKLGLETIRHILSQLGDPQLNFRAIHIAGTNGKGSVAAMLSTILHAAGYRVGRYTSPHLERFNERICINDAQMANADVVDAYKRVAGIKDLDRHPTFFEFATAMALDHFGRKKVDWAIIETGMGGRLDATNILIPELSIITNISLEHKEYLGNTIAAIAREKAGIIKPGVPLITGVRQPSARRVVFEMARKMKASAFLMGSDFRCRRQATGAFNYYGMAKTYRNLRLNLAGEHQIGNAALALAACEALAKRASVEISKQTIIGALNETTWPGRLEVVRHRPEVILDGAHNLMAARALAHHLRTRYANRRITMVVGILDDKPSEAILKDLASACRRMVVTQPKIDRADSAERLSMLAKAHLADVTTISDVASAVRHALDTSETDDVICIAGSLYVVGEAQTALRELGKYPDSPNA
jgi:dihydrofolate synthase / folylpolyglutamate synthase